MSRKKELSPLQAAQIELEEAKDAKDKAEQALNDFRGPFVDAEVSAQTEIYRLQAQLQDFRHTWSGAIAASQPVGEIESQIAETEKELRRAEERLRLSKGWQPKEAGKLKSLEAECENARYEWTEKHQTYVDVLRESLFESRETYLEACEDYWEACRQAKEENPSLKIPKFGSDELEVVWEEIRQRTGVYWN